MKKGIFVTGTDTGVGKTFVSALLYRALANTHQSPGYFKPVQTGDDDDNQTVSKLSGDPKILQTPPVYRFALPAAPLRAAQAENRTLELSQIVRRWRELPDRNWIVEGAGGLLVPLSASETTIDLVARLDLPLLIVARTQLGTINHTLLTIAAAKSKNLKIAGIVLVGEFDPGLPEILEQFGGVPILAQIPKLIQIDPYSTQQWAQKPEMNRLRGLFA